MVTGAERADDKVVQLGRILDHYHMLALHAPRWPSRNRFESCSSVWIMHGTNNGTLPDGAPATGRTVALHGASFAQFEGDKVRLERTYFDRQNLLEQLGVKGK